MSGETFKGERAESCSENENFHVLLLHGIKILPTQRRRCCYDEDYVSSNEEVSWKEGSCHGFNFLDGEGGEDDGLLPLSASGGEC